MVKKVLKNTMKILLLIFVLLAIGFAVFYYMYADIMMMEKAVINEDKEAFLYYVDEKDANPNKTYYEIDLITSYIMKNYDNADKDFIAFLLEKGVNPNIYTKISPLFHAINTYDEEIVQLLIDNGVDINRNLIKDNDIICKPLRWALQMGTCDIAKMLYVQGATLEDDTYEEDYNPKLEQCLSE